MLNPSTLRSTAPRAGLAVVFALAVVTVLSTGIVGGLLRAGVAVPVPGAIGWPAQAVLAHAFLMICGFMGTVVGLERAVAVKSRFAYLAPGASALAGLAMLAGHSGSASWLAAGAAAAFVVVNLVLFERQRAPHTALLLAGAIAWWIGNTLHALGSPPTWVIPWWFSFLVITIVAERLEMTRLMRRRRGAAPSLYGCLAGMLLGSALSAPLPVAGGIVYGLSLIGLAAWLVVHDTARRTGSAQGLSRYMAICLLLGYAWLSVAGAAWVATALGLPARDASLHALGLGFVFSMALGHVPVILPALAGVQLHFGGYFYLPVALLHVSLVVRLCLGPVAFSWLRIGAAGNAIAIALFAVTMAGSAAAWRARHSARDAKAVHAHH
ncbi:MAG: hypothetical protein ABIS28_20635 [Caldimonas sp.]